jgi:hypothetical protein
VIPSAGLKTQDYLAVNMEKYPTGLRILSSIYSSVNGSDSDKCEVK